MEAQSYSLNISQVLPHFAETLAYVDSSWAEKFKNIATKGTFFSLASRGLKNEVVLEFDNSMLPPSPKIPSGDGKYLVSEIKNLKFNLASIILQHASSLKSPVLYLHEPYLKKDEPNTKLSKALTVVGDHLFFIKPLKMITPEELEDRIHNYSVTWHSLAILVDQKELETSIDSLLSHALLIAVGAYKGESHLYWMR
jgi:hypothetical protein